MVFLPGCPCDNVTKLMLICVHFSFIKAEALDLEKTVLETVAEAADDWRLDDIKGLLGRCNFKADMLDRKVSFLSGGEKVRRYKQLFVSSLRSGDRERDSVSLLFVYMFFLGYLIFIL